jgi:hypothetical protein
VVLQQKVFVVQQWPMRRALKQLVMFESQEAPPRELIPRLLELPAVALVVLVRDSVLAAAVHEQAPTRRFAATVAKRSRNVHI